MKVPAVLVGGIDTASIATTLLSLSWDHPHAVVVRYSVDAEAGRLVRVTSDMSGEVERAEVDLDHGCLTCALDSDLPPMLERAVRGGRWAVVLAALPPGARIDRLRGHVDGHAGFARRGRVAACVTCLPGGSVAEDLLGDALFRERGSQSGPDDARGVGEVGCALVEASDAVVLHTESSAPAAVPGHALVSALAPLNAGVVEGAEHLDLDWLVDPTRRLVPSELEVRENPRGTVWQRLLSSRAPFEPGRLLDRIDELGGGRHRSRGEFWLPNRPDLAVEWDGSGGQLSIGPRGTWTGSARTRLLLTGVGVEPAGLLESFEALLCTPTEAETRSAGGDGFEPWLGPVRDVA